MGFKKFDGLSWLIGFLVGAFFFFISIGLSRPIFSLRGAPYFKGFCFDIVRFYLRALTIVLALSLFFWGSYFSFVGKISIFLSLVCSLLSYRCIKSLGFWVFYEGSILPLLFLLILESPYSERYIAS